MMSSNIKRALKKANMYFSLESYTEFFKNCENLEEIDLSRLQENNIEEVDSMCDGCSSLKKIDLTNIDSSNKKNLNNTFKNCSSLESINLSNWDTSNAKKTDDMFTNVPSLGFDGWHYDGFNYENFDLTESETNYSHIFPWNDKSLTINLIENTSTDAISTSIPSFTKIGDNPLDVYICRFIKKDGTITNDSTTPIKDVSKIEILYNENKFSKVSFEGLNLISTIENFRVNDKWTNLDNVFKNCSNLKNIDLSNWDTSNASSMASLFEGCTSLRKIDGIENINTEKVLYTMKLFRYCESLTSLDLSSWNTSNIVDMFDMFAYCSNITNINLGNNFVTNKCTNIQGMFINDSNLVSINTDWDTSGIIDMYGVFSGCISLTFLDLSTWNVRNSTSNNTEVFTNCSPSLVVHYLDFVWNHIDLTGFNVIFKDVSNIYTIKSSNTFSLYNYYEKIIVTDWGDGVTNSEATHNYSSANSYTIKTNIVHSNEKNSLLKEVSMGTVTPTIKFTNSSSLEKVNFNRVVNSDVLTDFSDMFSNCTSLKYVYMGDYSTYTVSNYSNMFNGVPVITDWGYTGENYFNWTLYEPESRYADTFPWNTYVEYKIHVKNADDLISAESDLTAKKYAYFPFIGQYGNVAWPRNNNERALITLNDGTITSDINISASNVKSIKFYYNKISSSFIDFSYVNIIEITKLDVTNKINRLLFSNCIFLESIVNIANWDVSEIQYFNNLFYNCNSITSFNLSNWNLQNSTSLENMFNNCTSLNSLGNISNWKVDNVTNMSGMFSNCSSLASLNLSNWDTSKNNVNAKNMFTNFPTSNNWNYDGNNYSNFTISEFDSDYAGIFPWNLAYMEYTLNGYYNESDRLTYQYGPTVRLYMPMIRTMSSDGITEDYYYPKSNDVIITLKTGETTNNLSTKVVDIEKVRINFSNRSTSKIHFNSTHSTEADRAQYVGTIERIVNAKFKNLSGAFRYCARLTYVNLEGVDTSEVTDMSSMFSNCNMLTTVQGFSSLDTGKVTNMDYIFNECKNLVSVDMSNIDTKNLISSNYAFYNCEKLTSIGSTTNWNTEKVKEMEKMFYNCKSLKSLNLSNWNTASLTKVNNLFSGCESLENLGDISNLNISNVNNLEELFANCRSLSSLSGVANWDLVKVASIRRMFYNCTSLTSLDLTSWNISKLANSSEAFYGCSSLSSLNLSTWNTNKIINSENMFNNVINNWYYDGNNYTNFTLTESETNYPAIFPWNLPYQVVYTLFNDYKGRALNYISGSQYPLYLPKIYSNQSTWSLPTADMTSITKKDGTITNNLNTLVSDIASVKIVFPGNTYSIRFEGVSADEPHLLQTIDSINTLKLVSLCNTFSNCTKLKSINESNSIWSTFNCIDMSGMFNNCSSLKDFNFVKKFDIVNVTNTSSMFSNTNFDLLDLSKWNTAAISSYSNMFYNCKLSNIVYYTPPIWTLPTSGTGFTAKFIAPYNVYEIDLALDTDNTDNTVRLYNKLNSNPFTYWGDGVINGGTTHTYDTSSNTHYTIYTNLFNTEYTIVAYTFELIDTDGIIPIFDDAFIDYDVSDIVNSDGTITRTIKSATIPSKISFEGKTELTEVSYINCENIKDMTRMFYNCTSLNSINLSNLDTNDITEFTEAFTNVPGNLDWNYNENDENSYKNFTLSESEIDYSGILPWNLAYLVYTLNGQYNTTDVITRSYSSSNYLYLPRLYDATSYSYPSTNIVLTLTDGTETTDLTKTVSTISKIRINFNKNIVKRISFYGISNTSTNRLQYLGTVEKLVNSKLTSMQNMFYYCRKITKINLSDVDFSNVTNMQNMFYYCGTLTSGFSLDLSNKDMSSLTSMSNMLSYSYVTSIDLSNTNLSKVTSMGSAFYNCTKLTAADLSNTNTSSLTNISNIMYSCDALTSANLTNLNTSKVTDMSYAFYNCTKLTTLQGLEGWNTDNVTNMSYMFNSCSVLAEVGISNWNTSKVTNMSYMFYRCKKITSLDLSSWNVDKVTNMGFMFNTCSSLESLDLSGWNTSKVTSMEYMFYGLPLQSIDLSHFNMTKVSTTKCMFYASKLTSLDLTDWDVSNISNMYSMFGNCSELESIDVSNWVTTKLSGDISCLFQSCSKLISLDLSSWNVSNVTKMDDLARECTSLKTVNLAGWNTSNVTSMQRMFFLDHEIEYLDLSSFDTRKVTSCGNMLRCAIFDKVNWNYDPLSETSYSNFTLTETGTNYNEIYSYYIFPWSYQPVEYTITPLSNTDYLNTTIDGEYIYLPKFYDTATSSYSINFPTIIITKKNGTTSNDFSTTLAKDVEKIEVRYYRENKLVIGLVSISTNPYTIQSQITTITKLYTDRQTDMSNLFTACKLLTSICDFRVTNLVTTTHSMFRECQVLPSIPGIANWDTSNVTDMTKMFQSCELLKSLDLTSFNTGKVTSTSCMFDRCYNLSYLNISGWNTNSVTNMESTFSSCRTLTEIIGVESLDVSNVTNMKGVFAGWGENIMKITSLDLSGWDISKVTDMTQMFQNCKSLTLLNLSNWDMRNVTEYYGMLSLTNNLTAEQWCYDGNNYNKWTLAEADVLYEYKFPWNETYIEYTLNSTLESALNTESYSSTEETIYLNLPKLYKKDGTGIEQTYNTVIITKTDDSTTSDLSTPINTIKSVRVYYDSLKYNAVKFGSMDAGVSLITGINYIDMRRIKDITAMFANCQSLASIDLSSFDTSNITDISNLFYECRLLYNINLSNWIIGKDVIVTNSFYNVPSGTTADWVYDNIKFVPTGPQCGFGTEFPWPSITTDIIDFTLSSTQWPAFPDYFTEYGKGGTSTNYYFNPTTFTVTSGTAAGTYTGLMPRNSKYGGYVTSISSSCTSWHCFKIVSPITGQLIVDFINIAESCCDYLQINLNTSTSKPSLGSSTSGIMFYGSNKTTPTTGQKAAASITEGTTYYLHLQYRKDSSVDNGIDGGLIKSIMITDDEANFISASAMLLSDDELKDLL